MNRTAIVFLSYFLSEELIARLNRLQMEASAFGDVYFLYDERGKVDSPTIPQGVRAVSFDREDWVRFKQPTRFHPTFIPGNTDYQFISFREQQPDYDYYWFLEYDVDFSGEWPRFFSHFTAADEDFISTTIASHTEIPDWNLWRSLTPPKGISLTSDMMLRAFLPIVRFSGQAIDVWRERAQAGWTGHSEAAIPTALAHASLRLRDIGGTGRYVAPGDENRFYRNTPANNDLTPGTFTFRPPFVQVGDEPDLLWHPVKGNGLRTWDASPSLLERTVSRVRRAAKRLAVPGHPRPGS